MDIALIRTFLEVAATGSFVSAADHLFVTPSAVSLRIQRLETELGKAVFTRSKAGAELTSAGREFELYAQSLVRIWEEARQQIAMPDGFTRSLTIGAQHSLWPRLGFRWMERLRRAAPDLSLRAEVGASERMTRYLVEGVVQAALIYTPQMRPGLSATELLDDELVMVAPWPDPDLGSLERRYAFVDWGPEFVAAHAIALEELTNPGITLSLGSLARDFLVASNVAGYLPARSAAKDIDDGILYLVPDAPRFPHPVWAVWRDDIEPGLLELIQAQLAIVVRGAERVNDQVLEELETISEEEIEVLGTAGAVGTEETA